MTGHVSSKELGTLPQRAHSFWSHNPSFPDQEQYTRCSKGSWFSQIGSMWFLSLPQTENHAEREVTQVTRGKYEKSNSRVPCHSRDCTSRGRIAGKSVWSPKESILKAVKYNLWNVQHYFLCPKYWILFKRTCILTHIHIYKHWQPVHIYKHEQIITSHRSQLVTSHDQFITTMQTHISLPSLYYILHIYLFIYWTLKFHVDPPLGFLMPKYSSCYLEQHASHQKPQTNNKVKLWHQMHII